MKWVKKSPLLVLLLSTGLLFTIIGIGGRRTIYANQEYDPIKAPVMSVLFTGLHEGIYPWQIFIGQPKQAMAQQPEKQAKEVEREKSASQAAGETEKESQAAEEIPEEFAASTELEEAEAVIPEETSPTPVPSVTSQPDEVPAAKMPQEIEPAEEVEVDAAVQPLERLAPLRESTREEYLNHISADIYGDAGVQRAAAYPFATVEESYFDDALFIGDSRMVGLRDYTDLSEHADFYCETSLTIYKVLEENFKGKGTIPDALQKKNYGKIYLMVGINELGRGTTEDFMAKYTEVADTLHELAPDAKIIMQATMRVSGKKNSSDAIFNNSNINARNNAIATLADNVHFFYIDGNEAVCDQEGNLAEEYTFDQIHLLGVYNDLYKQFLLRHGV